MGSKREFAFFTRIKRCHEILSFASTRSKVSRMLVTITLPTTYRLLHTEYLNRYFESLLPEKPRSRLPENHAWHKVVAGSKKRTREDK